MLCEKCGQREATKRSVFAAHEVDLCDDCYKAMLEYFKRIQKLAEEYGKVTHLPSQDDVIQLMVAQDSRFSSEAYDFVAEAVKEASLAWYSEHRAEVGQLVENWQLDQIKMPSKHLVVMLRRMASQRFGNCATATFNTWGITRWQDFGEIVSRMQTTKMINFWILEFRQEDFRSRGVLDDVFPER